MVVAVVGCGIDDETSSPSWSVAEEADSTIIYHGGIDDTPEIGRTVHLRIGSAEGPEWTTFGRIGSGRLLDDGGVAVSDMQSLRVHVYDSGGVHRISIGRRGGGPGEFGSINGLAETPRGLEVWDSRQQRLTEFDLDGALLGSVSAPPDPRLGSMRSWGSGYLAWALAGDGATRRGTSEFATRLEFAEVLRVSPDSMGRLLRVPWLEAGFARRDGVEMMVTLPFGRRGGIAAFDGGFAVVYSGEPEVLQFDRSGGLLRRLRLPAFERPLDPTAVDSMREAALQRQESPELREIVETGYSMPVPPFVPTFERVLVDGDVLVLGLHRNWVRSGRQPWLLLSPAGFGAGVLWLPEGERILDVKRLRVLVAGTAAAGVPEVRVLELDEWRSGR